MSLVLAIKNRGAIVVASDTDALTDEPGYGEMMTLSNRAVLLVAGNLEAVRSAIETALEQVEAATSAVEAAHLLSTVLTLQVVPHLTELKGRTELIIAGFDTIHQRAKASLYYLDSAQDFHLLLVKGDAVAAGATAAVTSLVAGHSYTSSNTDYLKVLAKECISATKLRWPTAVRGRIKLGVITPQGVLVQNL